MKNPKKEREKVRKSNLSHRSTPPSLFLNFAEEEEGGSKSKREKEKKNVWNICVFELQCEQREEVYSSGSLQWPPPFGIQRLRFCWDRHRFKFLRSNSIIVFLPQFHRLSAPARFSQRGQHRVPCQIRLSRSLLSLSFLSFLGFD